MAHLIGKIDIENLLKARAKFENFRQNIKTEQEQTAAIKAFEFSLELAWKTMKRVVEEQGIKIKSPKDCIREAAITGLISNPRIWFDFIDARNIAAHTYDESNVVIILNMLDDFSNELNEFIANLEKSK